MRMAIVEQRLDEFTNDNRSQRKGISELINTLDKIIKQTKKLRIDKTGKNDVIEKFTKDMSKLILTATQAITEKVTIAIRQMPIYIANNFTPSSKQTGK
jgi:soluble cytochrome b562